MNKKLDWEKGFKEKFHISWHNQIKSIIESEEIFDIYQTLKRDGEKYKITPESKNVFKCFEIDLNKVTICLFGQSPYPQIVLNSRNYSNIFYMITIFITTCNFKLTLTSLFNFS